MPTLRDGLVAVAIGGTIYAIGGQSGASLLDTVEAYDSATKSWTPMAGMPTARTRLAAAAVGGTIYAIGGGWSNIDAVEAYDIATDTWSIKASLSSARIWPVAAAVSTTIYVFGGQTGATILTIVEAYSTATDTWTVKASMPTQRRWFAAASVGTMVYVIGGVDPSGTTDLVEAYDTVADSWTTKASLPEARKNLVAVALGGKIYALGGAISNNTINTVDVYDPSLDTWQSQAGMLTGRSWLGAAAISGTIYAVGGLSGTYFSGSYVFNYEAVNEAAMPAINLPAMLTIEPAPAAIGQWVIVALTVTNTGGNGITISNLLLSSRSDLALASFENGPTPNAPVIIPGGGNATFQWTLSVSGIGQLKLAGSLSGVDNVSNELLAGHATASATLLTFIAPPSPPTNLTGSATVAAIKLAWDVSMPGLRPVSGYNLYRATYSGLAASAGNLLAQMFGAAATVYSDSSVISGVLYCYLVSAVDVDGRESASSNEACASLTVLPGAPTNLTALVADTSIALSWVAALSGTDPISACKLYRATFAGFIVSSGSLLVQLAGSTTTVFIDMNVINGILYCYRIRTVDTNNLESVSSNEVCAMIPLPPAPPRYRGAVRVFPNPFHPAMAIRGTIKFEGLPLGATVRIYSARGLKVWEGKVITPYLVEWDGRGEGGKPVAPGTYLWIAEGDGTKERGTLIVE